VAGTEKFITENPANNQVLAEVTNCTATEVDMAVEAATHAFYEGEWSTMGGYGRGILMNKLADAIEANAEELAMLEVMDNGKTLGEATGADLALTIQCYRYYAGWADKIPGSSVINPSGPVANGLFAVLQQEPVGVVGQIIPWNFPLLMQAWKLGPALATGCTSVMKTAPQTPLSALKVAALAKEVGFPDGVINIVPGDDNCGKLLANHDGLDKIAFTGSTGVGREIMKQAASSHKLNRVTLELGGKSPIVAFDDCDMDNLIGHSHTGLFLNQGQCCCAASRIFVQDTIYDEFVERATEAAAKRKVGAGWEDGAQQGTQVSKEQQDIVLKYIESGKKEGATLMTGGERWGNKGYFVQPTVFADVEDDMTIAREEIFGPVMSIMKFSTTDEAIARANNTEYGLGAAVFTKDFNKAKSTADKIRSGTVWINCYDTFDAALPFGGFKASGIGRELGEVSLKSYLEPKTIVFN
jgi:aldehyde dehydrogenase (NAD+)